MYDPKNPETIHSGMGFGIYAMVIGGAILILVIGVTVKQKVSVKQLKETQGETVYAPYFFTSAKEIIKNE